MICEAVENNLIVSELEYGLEFHCSRGRTQQAAEKDDNETRPLRKTTMIDDKTQTTSSDTGTHVL